MRTHDADLYISEFIPINACFDSDGYFKTDDELLNSEKIVVKQLENGTQLLKHLLPGITPYIIGSKEPGENTFKIKNNTEGKQIVETLIDVVIQTIVSEDDEYIHVKIYT